MKDDVLYYFKVPNVSRWYHTHHTHSKFQAKKASGYLSLSSTTGISEGGKSKKFCFKLETDDPKHKIFYIAADTEEEMRAWMDDLGAAVKVYTCLFLSECDVTTNSITEG